MKYARNASKIAALISVAGLASACTGQLPNSFALQQQQETFSSQLKVNTKIDLLWVVDNSSSMDINQAKLRAGFSAFAQKYLQPTWDIQVAVITTDTYLANSAFTSYLNGVVASTGSSDNYIKNVRTAPWVEAYSPALLNGSKNFARNLLIKDLVPSWGPNYAMLLPGIHDGPIAGLCSNFQPYFLLGESNCSIRDNNPTLYSDASHCLNPGSGESSVTQCVNTVENNTIHSGSAIISTMPPSNRVGDPTWTTDLNNMFMLNVSAGTSGHGSERGMGSVLQLISDNEVTAHSFFRPGSLRGIIFVSDEDDQTQTLPGSQTTPWTHYACDQSSLVAMNSGNTAAITGVNGMCCTGPNNCRLGSEGLSCPSKTIQKKDGSSYSYTVSVCAANSGSYLMPVSTVKSQLDSFFTNLDGAGSSPNYFVVSIVATDGDSVSALQAVHNADDSAAGNVVSISADRGDRYIALGNAVGNGSMALDISSSDYSSILDSIGQTIIAKKGTFTLARAPTSQEDVLVRVLHQDGTTTTISSSKYTVSTQTLTITDLTTVLAFTSTDQVVINYQPKTVF